MRLSLTQWLPSYRLIHPARRNYAKENIVQEDVENHEVELDPVAAGCLFHLLINNRQDMEKKSLIFSSCK